MQFRFLLPLAFLFVSCNAHDGMQKITLTSEEKEITVWVEIADDSAERSQGLMEREELPENQGMLFIFQEPKKLSFWMKNTLIPLDILFFDTDGNFINVQTMDPCSKDPCKTYLSDRSAKYALEVSAGFVEKNGIGAGWKISL